MRVDFDLPIFDKDKLEEVENIIEKILIYQGTEKEDLLLDELKKVTGYSYESEDFVCMEYNATLEYMAKWAIINDVKKGIHIEEDELAELISLICSGDLDEFATDYYISLLNNSINCSNCSDYIFWPGKCGVNENLTPKELAKRILKDSKEKIIYL